MGCILGPGVRTGGLHRFRTLANTPIVVLSNNDSAVIARSYDAKPFVKMGAPYFQIKDVLRRHGIVAFSSNYAL